jgi:hypothetical protein
MYFMRHAHVSPDTTSRYCSNSAGKPREGIMNTTVIETRTAALQRLAQVARESGVKLMRDTDGEYWVTSISEPGWLYAVTPESCGCRGFATHRRCRHVAALWSHLGWLDPEPEPSVCSACAGSGVIEQPRSRWVGGGRLGYRDQWSTPVACPNCCATNHAA